MRSKTIKLTQGYEVIVDSEDYLELSKYKWYAQINKLKNRVKVYARRFDQGKIIYMHRSIMHIAERLTYVDHIDGNTLNNRKSNLRVCTASQNAQNNSGWVRDLPKGVYRNKKKYMAQISVKGEMIHLGTYVTIEEATQTYNKAALMYFGEFARLNIITKESHE